MFRPRNATMAPVLIVFCLSCFPSFLSAGQFDGRLPIWPAEELDLDGALPEAVELFVEQNGRDFSIYWDAKLGSARMVAPTTELSFLSSGDADPPITADVEAELRYAASEFIDRNALFFGITSQDLGDEVARRFDGCWVLVLRQKVGDVFVRGACVRFLVGKKGNLLWVESFLLPGATSPGVFASAEPARNFIAEDRGYRLIEEEKQLYFPRYDPRSVYPIWRIQAETPDGVLAEFFADYQSGELIEERHVMFHLDGGVEKVAEGAPPIARLLSLQPTTDPLDPRYFFTTPGDLEPDQPLPGPQILSGLIFTTAGPAGNFALPVSPSEATVRLDTFMCGGNDLLNVGGVPFCPSDLLQTHGLVRVLRTENLFSKENGTATYEARIDRADGQTALRIDVETPPVPPQPGVPPEMREEELQSRRRSRAAELMAFHHVTEFVTDHRRILTDLTLDPAGIAVPLDVRVAKQNVSDFLYTPSSESPAMIRISAEARNAQGGQQWLTPTILNHEYAHHILFEISGGFASETFHCYPTVQSLADCIEEKDKDDHDELAELLDVAIMEGLADALAAFRANTPLFGFYAPNPAGARGDLSYDLMDTNFQPGRRTRGIVANLFWRLRNEMSDTTLRNIPGLSPALRDRGPEIFVYSWLLAHLTSDGTDQTGILSPTFMAQLRILDRAVFGDQEPGKGWHDDFLAGLEAEFTGSADFVRGDVTSDGKLDISDPIAILHRLFVSRGLFTCVDAHDVDDSGVTDITDAVVLIVKLFLGRGEIAPPNVCGRDPTPEDTLDCIAFGACEQGF